MCFGLALSIIACFLSRKSFGFDIGCIHITAIPIGIGPCGIISTFFLIMPAVTVLIAGFIFITVCRFFPLLLACIFALCILLFLLFFLFLFPLNDFRIILFGTGFLL
jgi:hypothetical protein